MQLVINGLLLGGAYTIISLGLTSIFGVVRVVNFAHGEFLMIGMYLVLSDRERSSASTPTSAWFRSPSSCSRWARWTQQAIIQPLLQRRPAYPDLRHRWASPPSC